MEVRQIPRIILRGDRERASYRAREGMRQLNILKELMGFQKLKQDVRRVQYIDKSEIICKSIFGEETVEIYVPKKEEGRISKKPIVLVAVGRYSHPTPPTLAPNVNAYFDFETYPNKVVLFDVEEDEIIETIIDDVIYRSITTTQLKEYYGIDVWHPDELTGIPTDKGFRLSDDPTHEKSFPLSRYLNRTSGFTNDVFVYAHGAHALPAVAWTADAVPPPSAATYPPPPMSCAGSCWWNQSKYEASNINTKDVDTKGTDEVAVNSHEKSSHIFQRDLLLRNLKLTTSGLCPLYDSRGFKVIDTGSPARASWICEVSAVGPVDIIKENYLRFGGSYRTTTRDKYPSLDTGQIGYIRTTFHDYQDQLSWTPGGVAAGGGGTPHPCPHHNGTTIIYNRNIGILVSCSFGDIYSTSFNHGSYDYCNCPYEGTQVVDGDDFEFPGTEQAFMGIEAGIVNSKVISVATIVAGTERIAWPYIGDWANPGKWDNTAVYKQPKAQGVKAGITVTELDKELDFVDMIMSANDIDYFSLPIEDDNNFELAVKELVEEYYNGDDTYIDSAICLESRVVEQHLIKRATGEGEWTRYSSCQQPNPWLAPKIGQEFWRPL